MGRSVSYLDRAITIIYFTADWLNTEEDIAISEMNWEDFEYNLTATIINKLKSYCKVEEWDNRETKIFLKNELCNIGISEYCGLYSLSVSAIDYDGYYKEEISKINFAQHHAKQIKNTLCKALKDCGVDVLNRLGTFSSGEAVYELANKEDINV